MKATFLPSLGVAYVEVSLYVEIHPSNLIHFRVMDTVKSNQFFNLTISHIFIIYTNYITLVTLLITPIYFYIVLTQSSNLKTYKWFILNHSFWCLCFLLSVAIVKPILLLYCGCGFQTGMFRETSTATTIWTLIIVLGLAIMSVGGVCMSLSYRYFGLFPGKVKTICRSLPMQCFFIALHILIWIILILCATAIMKIPRETMIQQALEFNPELEPFTHEKSFMFVPESVYTIAAIAVLILLAFLTIVYLGAIYLLKKELMSKLRSELQKNLIISVIAQVSVTLIFEFSGYVFLFLSLMFKIPNSGPAMEVFEILMVSHTFIEYCVTLYFVLPYRRFILKKLYTVKNLFENNFSKNKVILVQPRRSALFNCSEDVRNSDNGRYGS